MQLIKDISTCGARAGVFAQPRPKADMGRLKISHCSDLQPRSSLEGTTLDRKTGIVSVSSKRPGPCDESNYCRTRSNRRSGRSGHQRDRSLGLGCSDPDFSADLERGRLAPRGELAAFHHHWDRIAGWDLRRLWRGSHADIEPRIADRG